MAAYEHLRRIIDFKRVRNRHQGPGLGPHPEGLIVRRPVHDELVAGFDQQLGGLVALRHPGTHPAAHGLPGVLENGLTHLGQQAGLVGGPQMALGLGVGAAMADDFIAALEDGLQNLRAIVEDDRVHQVGRGQLQFVKQIQQAPDADAVAVVAPGEAADVGLGQFRAQAVPASGPEGEMLDVQAQVDGQSLALGPTVVRTRGDGAVGITVMVGKQHEAGSMERGTVTHPERRFVLWGLRAGIRRHRRKLFRRAPG
ncbi:hypothetical protein D3C85_254470 [compost metagenome]